MPFSGIIFLKNLEYYAKKLWWWERVYSLGGGEGSFCVLHGLQLMHVKMQTLLDEQMMIHSCHIKTYSQKNHIKAVKAWTHASH